MQISFNHASDLHDVKELLLSLAGTSNRDLEVVTEKNNTLYIKVNRNEEYMIQTYIVPALSKFIIKRKEPTLFRNLLSTVFFFHDESEQQQIIQMVYSIISEDEANLHPQLREGYRREELLTQALTIFLSNQNIYFSFEAFLKFRLKDYYNRLLDYIEVAIDEYKLEQDYQDFIESLRKYIGSKTRTAFSQVHVVYENERFLFYDENFDHFTYQVQSLEDDFISVKGFEVDQELIAPLLLICPKEIYLYVLDVDHGMIQMVMNIFQERVKVLPHERFYEQQH